MPDRCSPIPQYTRDNNTSRTLGTRAVFGSMYPGTTYVIRDNTMTTMPPPDPRSQYLANHRVNLCSFVTRPVVTRCIQMIGLPLLSYDLRSWPDKDYRGGMLRTIIISNSTRWRNLIISLTLGRV